MTALLTVRGEDKEKTLDNLKEAKRMGIKVNPPCINRSFKEFTPDEDAIRFGLLSIGGIGQKAVDAIINERKNNGEFADFNDFHDRITNNFVKTEEQKSNPVNRTVFRTLIEAGCFDMFEPNRYRLMNHYNFAIRRDKVWEGSYEDLQKDSKKSNHSYRFDVDSFNDKLMLEMEYNLIGIYVSGSPYEGLPFTSLQDMDISRGRHDKSLYDIGGRVTKMRVIKTKKGDDMAFVEIETQLEPIEFTVFPDTYSEYSQHLYKDNIIVVRGYKEKSFYRGEDREQFIAQKVLVKDAKKLKKQMGIDDKKKHQKEAEEMPVVAQSEKKKKDPVSDLFDHPPKPDPVSDLFEKNGKPRRKKQKRTSKELGLDEYMA